MTSIFLLEKASKRFWNKSGNKKYEFVFCNSKACDYEISRQIEIYKKGGEIFRTRLWDEAKQLTKSMRLKEGSSDYRYFPDPDLGPIQISKEQKEKWFNELPELPSKKRKKYVEN